MEGEGLLAIDEMAVVARQTSGKTRITQDIDIVSMWQHVGDMAGFVTSAITGTFPFIPAAVLAALLAVATSAQAQVTQLWDGSQTTANNTVEGGTGTWNTITTNWTNAGGSLNDTWQSGLAIFQGASGTVTVGGNVAFGGMQFVTTGYTINGSGTLAAAPATRKALKTKPQRRPGWQGTFPWV